MSLYVSLLTFFYFELYTRHASFTFFLLSTPLIVLMSSFDRYVARQEGIILSKSLHHWFLLLIGKS